MWDNFSAMVIIPDHALSQAIGKGGQNARLVAKLTGCRIDVRRRSAFPEVLMVDESER